MAEMIILYSSTQCTPCSVSKSRLKAAGIPFEEINLEENPEVLERLKKSLDVPFITTPLFRFKGKLRQIDVLPEIIASFKESV